MEESTSEIVNKQLKRPTMLTVVCILSFIGSGWGLFDSATDYFGAPLAEDSIEEVDEAMEEIEDQEVPESFMNLVEGFVGNLKENMTIERIRTQAKWNGLSSLLTLIGAILMFLLNRKGFYLYLAGIALYIVTPLISFTGTLAVMSTGIAVVIGAIFVTLYAVNLKHMRA